MINRREAIKGILFTFALFESGKTYAGDYKNVNTTGIKKLANREDPTISEQKNVPAIEAPEKVNLGEWFDLKVKVGFLKAHPSSPEHWITMIKLLIDGKDIAITNFKVGGKSAPIARFRVKLVKSSTVEAIEHCNLHGTWISDKINIRV